MNERDTTIRLRAGDREGADALFREHGDWLLRYVRRVLDGRVRRDRESGDIVQQVLRSVWLRVCGDDLEFENERQFRGYLATTADHSILTALEHIHRARRDPRCEEGLADQAELPKDHRRATVASPATDVANAELRAMAMSKLESLPAEDRELVRLRVEEGRSWSEIGDRVGISDNGARKRYERIVARLSCF